MQLAWPVRGSGTEFVGTFSLILYKMDECSIDADIAFIVSSCYGNAFLLLETGYI